MAFTQHSERSGSEIFRRSRFFLGLLCAAIIGISAYYSTTISGAPSVKNQASLQENEQSYEGKQRLIVTNKYGAQPPSVEAGYYDWGQVVEPHKLSTMTLTDSSHERELQWTITLLSLTDDEKEMANLGSDEADFSALNFPPKDKPMFSKATKVFKAGSSHEMKYKFTRAGRYYLVTVMDSSGNTLVKEKIICKYVRRELRNLDDEDREQFLNAIHEVMVNTQESGEAKYGETFITGHYFTAWHLGSKSLHSPYHGMPTFFTAHAFFAAMFERSMQSVEPATALHYWDYTIDAQLYNNKGKWTDSFFWSSDWFGPVASDDTDNTDKRALGRWADVPIVFDRQSETHNSYGLVTEPHNNNPSTYLTRSFSICGLGMGEVSLPDCKVLKGTLKTTNMLEFHTATEEVFHLELHSIFGGSWECGANIKESMEQSESLSTFLEEMTTVAVDSLAPIWKANYYDGYLTCPENCTLSTPYEDCQCVDENIESFFKSEVHGKQDDEAVYSLFKKHCLAPLLGNDMLTRSRALLEYDDDSDRYVMKSRTFATSVKFYRHWLKLIARGAKVSPFMSPQGSANDPIFWPIHVGLDKLWHYRRVVSTFNSSWTPGHDSYMTGWGYHDPVEPMTNAYGIIRESNTYFTNQEIVMLFHPKLTQLPYMYDDYGFAHCFN